MIRLFTFIAGVALLIYLVLQIGPDKILSVVVDLRWNLLWVTLIYYGAELFRAAALWVSLAQAESQPYVKMLAIQLSGEAAGYLSFIGPFAGGPLKAWLLRKAGLRTTGALAAVITEYLVYTLVAAVMAIGGLSYMLLNLPITTELWIAGQAITYFMAAFLVAAAIAIGFRFYLIGAVANAMRKLPLVRNRIPWNREQIHEMEDLLFHVLRDSPLKFISLLGLECAAHALLVGELYWIVKSAGVSFGMFEAFLIEAATKFLAVAFFFVPMQVGVAEKTYGILFGIFNLSLAIGVGAALVRRVRTVVASLTGFLILMHISKPR